MESQNPKRSRVMQSEQDRDTKTDDDILWGVAEIGEEIRRTERQASYLLNSGLIRCARKVGHQWTAVRGELRREVTQRNEAAS
jgi:hypothetical protein